MAFVSSMILRSMRLIGEKARGATLDSNESTECLAEFNTFLDSLPNERLLAYSIQQDSHTLTSGVSTYTIGTNGAFAVTRPVKIVEPCFVRDSDSTDYPVRVVDAVTYGRLSFKTEEGSRPEMLYYDAGLSATSTATIHLYPVPNGPLTLHINSWKQIGSVSTVSQNLALPPGYQLFLESNFAIHLAAGQADVSPALLKMAKESKAAIKGLNVPAVVARLDALPIGSGRGNILTGDSYYQSDYVE
jgi:hypothetical protein